MGNKNECELIGTYNIFGISKVFTCLELPVQFIHKPIGKWMCVSCAWELLRQRGAIPK